MILEKPLDASDCQGGTVILLQIVQAIVSAYARWPSSNSTYLCLVAPKMCRFAEEQSVHEKVNTRREEEARCDLAKIDPHHAAPLVYSTK